MKSAHSLAATLATLLIFGCAAPSTTSRRDGVRYEQIPGAAYAVVAEVRAKPGMEDALRAITLPLVEQVRNEPNNLLYFLHEDRESAGHFVFYEIFASRADFEAHNASPHVQAWFARLPELAAGGVRVARLELRGN